MSVLHSLVLTVLAMLAFAGNSLLCRAALLQSGVDPASFTTVRLVSGALVLAGVVALQRARLAAMGVASAQGRGNWGSAAALFAYAAGFSLAYTQLPAGTGALLLFGAVQATMIGHGIARGERLRGVQVAGLVLALGGLVGLLLPGLSAPPWRGAALMLGAGVAWGVYSLRGRGAGDPTRVTAGNFMRATPMALAWSLWGQADAPWASQAMVFAVVSGAVTSGLGYAVWYRVLPHLRATSAATVQLSVPVIAALGGTVLLAEPLSQRLGLASVAVLGGIALVIWQKSAAP